MGSAGFEPATSSAQGWHHTKLDNDPPYTFTMPIYLSISVTKFYFIDRAHNIRCQHNFKFR